MIERTLENELAQYSEDCAVVRELHDVPPYRVYEIRIGDRRAVAKIDDHPRGHAADEGRIHEYVDTHTSAGVPGVLAVGSEFYVTNWHEALAASPETVDQQWAHAAGVWLGRLHDDTAGAFDGFGRPRDGCDRLELTAHDEWTDAVLERIAYHRQFLPAHGYADLVNAVERFFREHPDVFDGVGEPVLCHGDVHPEHHVRTESGAVLAIDFEHALVAPAAYDYWRTVMPYFEAPDDVGEDVTTAFQAGYESVRALPEGIEQRRPLFRLLNWIAFLESLHLQKTVEATKRERMGEWMYERAFETLEEVRETVG